MSVAGGQLVFAVIYNAVVIAVVAGAVVAGVPAHLIAAGAVFIVGAATGSWLNVVVYRLPRGWNLNDPPSQCPVCGQGIRRWHNIPIVGWLVLRGRCHDCRTAISARYPMVELLTATLLVGLAAAEVSVGAGGPPAVGHEPLMVVAFWVYHAVLICGLVSAVLIVADGHRLPRRLGSPVLSVGLAMPVVIPGLQGHSDPLAAVTTAAVGAFVGWWVALALRRWPTLGWPLAWAGAFVGWPVVLAAAAIGELAAVIGVTAAVLRTGLWPRAWPSQQVDGASVLGAATAAAVIALAAALAGWLRLL